MQLVNRLLSIILIACLFAFFTTTVVTAQTQRPMTIRATATGTSTQLGRMYDINIYIQSYSTQEDRKTLINAFNSRGQDGLVDVLQDMNPKGRIRFSNGGVGNDIKYIIELPSQNGRRLRLVTDRWLMFGELYASTRSKDYSVGAIELNLTPDGKGSGTVLPACKLTVNKKKKQIEIETYQNPWNLSNFMISND